MSHLQIHKTPVKIRLEDYYLEGKGIASQERYIRDLQGIFADETAYQKLDPNKLIYSVQSHFPVNEGTPGGLFFGTTNLMSGKVGNEYFMTKGHFHSEANRGEFYWGIKGNGMLLLMDEERNTWAEEMYPGSLHYIGGYIAHRVANIEDQTLIFGACWPSDAGHNYEEIAQRGFSARLIEKEGKPFLIDNTNM